MFSWSSSRTVGPVAWHFNFPFFARAKNKFLCFIELKLDVIAFFNFHRSSYMPRGHHDVRLLFALLLSALGSSIWCRIIVKLRKINIVIFTWSRLDAIYGLSKSIIEHSRDIKWGVENLSSTLNLNFMIIASDLNGYKLAARGVRKKFLLSGLRTWARSLFRFRADCKWCVGNNSSLTLIFRNQGEKWENWFVFPHAHRNCRHAPRGVDCEDILRY